MADEDEQNMFAGLLVSLEGVHYLEKPRVSRETLISVTKEHTVLLRSIRETMGYLTTTMKQVLIETAENRETMNILKEDTTRHQTDIDKLYNSTGQLRKEMSIIDEKLTDLFQLKQELSDQKEFVHNLSDRFEAHTLHMASFQEETNVALAAHNKKFADTQFQISELKHYVEHIGDSLVLPSSQIRVEPSAGFFKRPMTLLDTLTQCTANFDELQALTTTQGETLVSHQDQIDLKAPDTLIMNMAVVEKKVANIEYILQKEEEQGIGAIRRQCDQLTADFQNMTSELAEKVNKDSVNLIVHEKYEEIVKYLQDALQSSAEDEQNFKIKADELIDLVSKLNNSKADRVEIAPMQEVLVRTEAMLKKVNANHKNDKFKDMFTRKELDAILASKIDRTDYDHDWQSFTKLQKKNKLNSIMAGLPKIVDLAKVNPDEYPGGKPGGPQQDRAMWKGLADAMRTESDSAVLRSSIHTPGGEVDPDRMESSALDAGHSFISNFGNSQHNSHVLDNSATGAVNGIPEQMDFASYIHSKRSSTGKGTTQPTFPSNHNPGAFRKASEGGKPGGLVHGSVMSNSSFMEGFAVSNASTYPVVPPGGEDFNLVGTPMVGPAINMRGTVNKPLQLPQATHHGSGTAGSNSDQQMLELDGLGYVMKGSDGHLYYSDPQDPSSGSGSPVTVPTSKQIVPMRVAVVTSPRKK